MTEEIYTASLRGSLWHFQRCCSYTHNIIIEDTMSYFFPKSTIPGFGRLLASFCLFGPPLCWLLVASYLHIFIIYFVSIWSSYWERAHVTSVFLVYLELWSASFRDLHMSVFLEIVMSGVISGSGICWVFVVFLYTVNWTVFWRNGNETAAVWLFSWTTLIQKVSKWYDLDYVHSDD